jgi:hypothetical protein
MTFLGINFTRMINQTGSGVCIIPEFSSRDLFQVEENNWNLNK